MIRKFVPAYLPLLSELTRAPATIIHGDLHLDNVIFGLAGVEPRVWIIDWQGAMRGPAVLDLTFVNSLTIESRRASERNILASYHTTLVEHGVTAYPIALLERHYHLALLADAAGTVDWLGTVDLEGLVGRERDIVESIIEESKLLTALLDHHVESLF